MGSGTSKLLVFLFASPVFVGGLMASAGLTSTRYQANKQTEKDRQIFEKLESDLRPNVEDLIREASTSSDEVPLPPRVPDPQLESVYDKFKDLTTVSVQMPVHHALLPPKIRADGSLRDYLADVDVFAVYSFEGQRPIKPLSFTLIFKSTGTGAVFGVSPSLIFLVDGQRLKLGNMQERTVYRTQGIVDEYTSVEMHADVFELLAKADIVEAQVGHIEFSFSHAQLKGFRMLAGLPDKEPRPTKKSSSDADLFSEDLAGTTWRGDKFSAQFNKGGEVVLEGAFAERIGNWSRAGDRVELILPASGGGQARILGLGILKSDKIAIKFRVQSLFRGSTVTAVMQVVRVNTTK
jgi:hypothetical protein